MKENVPHVVFIMANNPSVPYFLNFMRVAQERRDIRFSFIAMTKEFPKMVEEANSFGFDGYWVKYDTNKKKVDLLKSVWRLYKLFKKIKPDVVHTHLFEDSVAGLLAARLAGIPKRAILKDDVGFHYNYARKWMWLDKLNNNNATHVVAPTHEAKEFIINIEKCNPNKIVVVHNGIDVERFANSDPEIVNELSEKLDFKNRFVIDSISRFIKWKGYEGMLEVAKVISKEIPESKFVWVGYGSERENYQKIIKDEGLSEHVLIPDLIPHNIIHNLYHCFDIFLHNAFMEPFGFVIAEAMAAGVPVVSTPTGAARDGIQHKVNGYLGEYYRPETLIEGIRYVYQNQIRRPVISARNTARELFSFQKMYDGYKQIYYS